MNALDKLTARGITLAIDDAGRLRAKPKERLDAEARRIVEANRAALVRAVTNRQALAAFCLDWMADTCPDDYFASPAVKHGADADFWRRMNADLDAHCDTEEPAAFILRVCRWKAEAAKRFAAWGDDLETAG